ncbi:MAG: hypothetical protein DRJ14_09670 [Acidobacteria bacterium]|nr:MAG: hypothetical protein DRJ14_09670 [Acidobacteriota bacterium]
MGNSRKIIISLMFIFAAAVVWGRTYYIPHVHTANDSWETYLIADNLQNPDPQGFYLTLYDDAGAVVVDHRYYEVAAGQSLTITLRPLNGVDGEVESGSNSLRLRLGYMAKESTGGGTAEFDLPSKLSNKVVFSTSNYYDQLTWSGFAVFNGSDDEVTADVTVMTTSGNSTSQVTIPAKGKVVNYFEAQFGVPYGDINDVVFSADTQSLTGITISGKDNDKLLFTGTGSDREGWFLKNHEEYLEIHGIARANGTAIVADYGYTQAAGSYGEIKGIRINDGCTMFTETAGYENLFPLGIVSDAGRTMVFAYGIDSSNASNPSYFVARVNPADGTIMWKKVFSDAIMYDDLYPGRICAATDGTATVQVNVRNESHMVETYSFTVGDGTQTFLSRSFNGIPTSISYDGTTGKYYSIFSRYDSTAQRYSTIVLLQNTPGNLSGTSSSADFSTLVQDGVKHHVLMYGGGIVSGKMSLIISSSIGTQWQNNSIDISDDWPAQYFMGSVSLTNFQSDAISTEKTWIPGSMGDDVHIVKDEDNYVYAFCGSPLSTWLGRTLVFEFSDFIIWTLPAQVSAASDDDMLLLGFQKYWFSDRPAVQITKRTKDNSVKYNGNTYLQRVTFDDMMAEYCR